MKICGQAETLFRPIRTRLFLHKVSYAHTMNFIGLVRSALPPRSSLVFKFFKFVEFLRCFMNGVYLAACYS